MNRIYSEIIKCQLFETFPEWLSLKPNLSYMLYFLSIWTREQLKRSKTILDSWGCLNIEYLSVSVYRQVMDPVCWRNVFSIHTFLFYCIYLRVTNSIFLPKRYFRLWGTESELENSKLVCNSCNNHGNLTNVNLDWSHVELQGRRGDRWADIIITNKSRPVLHKVFGVGSCIY